MSLPACVSRVFPANVAADQPAVIMTLGLDAVKARDVSAILKPMKRIGKRLALALPVLLGVLALAAWQFGPELGSMLPGRVRQYLPEPVLGVISEPLPAALPVPQQPATTIDLDPLLDIQPTPTPLPVQRDAPSRTEVATTPPPGSGESGPAATPIASPVATGGSPTITPSPTSWPLPAQVTLSGVDIIPQKFNNCGPANLSMVLAYHGLEHSQLDVAAVIRPTYEDRNVSPHELAAYVAGQTPLEATVFFGASHVQLKALLAAGLPVIVEKGLEDDGSTGWMGHYLTLYGYDEDAGHFLARDTFLGPWDEDGYESYADLSRLWHQFNNVLVVVYDPAMKPAVADILGPGIDDATVMWRAAVDKARGDVRADPNDAFAWFNLGSSLVATGEPPGDGTAWRQAAASFDQARLYGLPARMLWYQFAPYEAYLAVGRARDVVELAEATMATQGGRSVEETYLFLGYAYQALGEETAARDAFGQAIALSPTSPVAATAEEALAQMDS